MDYYIVIGVKLGICSGCIEHIGPLLCSREEEAKKVLHREYEKLLKEYGVEDKRYDDINTPLDEGGYFMESRAVLYAVAGFAMDTLNQVASITVSRIELPLQR